MVKLNGSLTANYNRALRNRIIGNENAIGKRGRGRPSKKAKSVVVEKKEKLSPLPSVPNDDEDMVFSVKLRYSQSQNLLHSKDKHLKGWFSFWCSKCIYNRPVQTSEWL